MFSVCNTDIVFQGRGGSNLDLKMFFYHRGKVAFLNTLTYLKEGV